MPENMRNASELPDVRIVSTRKFGDTVKVKAEVGAFDALIISSSGACSLELFPGEGRGAPVMSPSVTASGGLKPDNAFVDFSLVPVPVSAIGNSLYEGLEAAKQAYEAVIASWDSILTEKE